MPTVAPVISRNTAACRSEVMRRTPSVMRTRSSMNLTSDRSSRTSSDLERPAFRRPKTRYLRRLTDVLSWPCVNRQQVLRGKEPVIIKETRKIGVEVLHQGDAVFDARRMRLPLGCTRRANLGRHSVISEVLAREPTNATLCTCSECCTTNRGITARRRADQSGRGASADVAAFQPIWPRLIAPWVQFDRAVGCL